MFLLMTPEAPVGAENKKLPLPLAISVAVLALGATGCTGGDPKTMDGGTCPLPECHLDLQMDGGMECICGV